MGTARASDTGGPATTAASPATTAPASDGTTVPPSERVVAPENRPEDIPPPWPAGDPALASFSFTDVTAEAGLDVTHSDLPLIAESGMTSGVTVADVDRDGDHDVFLPRVGKPDGLFLNDGSGRFTDVAEQAGVAGPPDRAGSSAGVFADFDADGHLDLFVTGAGRGANQLFMNNGDGTFREESDGARGGVARGAPAAGGQSDSRCCGRRREPRRLHGPAGAALAPGALLRRRGPGRDLGAPRHCRHRVRRRTVQLRGGGSTPGRWASR